MFNLNAVLFAKFLHRQVVEKLILIHRFVVLQFSILWLVFLLIWLELILESKLKCFNLSENILRNKEAHNKFAFSRKEFLFYLKNLFCWNFLNIFQLFFKFKWKFSPRPSHRKMVRIYFLTNFVCLPWAPWMTLRIKSKPHQLSPTEPQKRD